MKSKDGILNDKGFSLIEMIVVIGIMAVLVGLSSLSIAMINNLNVNKAAREFNSALTQARAQSIAKGTAAGTLYLRQEANGDIFYTIGDPTFASSTKLCSGSIQTMFVPYTGAGSYLGGVAYGWTGDIAIAFSPSGVVLDNDSYKPCQFVFKRNNRKVSVVLYRQTGKHEVLLVD